ncbi:MAG: hypothetical protein PHI34_01530 [Acidobacteriota bacterium]|nr:hypothetical protein [Acidobacteriota bacterium]
MTKKWMLLFLVLAAAACFVPPPGPGYPPGPAGPGLSSYEIRNAANQAVCDFVIRRHGREAVPRTSSVRIRAVGRTDAEVIGTVTFDRSRRVRVREHFRCQVNRFDGRVANIDLF